MHYLIIGAAGFSGSYLVEYHIAQGNRVTVIDDLSSGRIENLINVVNYSNFWIIIRLILEKDLGESLIQKIDTTFHLASAVGVRLMMDHPVEKILRKVCSLINWMPSHTLSDIVRDKIAERKEHLGVSNA